jgi:phosphoribosylamine--glycine ligase / phosphoribosylformylglycinamidine cyclo-ligase
MSVNDLLVQGAEPLYFLDYYGCSKLDIEVATQVVKGIAEGCKRSGCALIGGETAEMPGMYEEGDYDLAGFAVGAVERDAILPRQDIQSGDVLLGLASSGLHSNGFSLVRKIIARTGISYSDECPWDPSRRVGEAILEPTAIYVSTVLPTCKRGLIKGMSHITGGGFTENIPRVLPKGLGCFVDASAWKLPPVFKFLKEKGEVDPLEMARTFNNGVGLVVIVGASEATSAQQCLAQGQFQCWRIGEVIDKPGVEMRNLESWSS